MTELFRNAWSLGWVNYTTAGKIAALLLVGILLFWFAGKRLKKSYAVLGVYTTVMTVLCICPLTAGVLMQYQTKFYDYPWIWGYVPVTVFIALVLTVVWCGVLQRYEKQKNKTWKCVGFTLVLFAVVCLCGHVENVVWNHAEEEAKYEEAVQVLEAFPHEEGTEIVLWAPQKIMEYARMIDGSIKLPYGRNMWERALNAYTYDVYGEKEIILYEWMKNAEKTGKGKAQIEVPVAGEENATKTKAMPAKRCLKTARELGVTHVLLPGNMKNTVMAGLEKYLGESAQEVEGYYLLRLQ